MTYLTYDERIALIRTYTPNQLLDAIITTAIDIDTYDDWAYHEGSQPLEDLEADYYLHRAELMERSGDHYRVAQDRDYAREVLECLKDEPAEVAS